MNTPTHRTRPEPDRAQAAEATAAPTAEVATEATAGATAEVAVEVATVAPAKDATEVTAEATAEFAADWALRLASGSLTRADARRLEDWLAAHPAHREALDHARRVWGGIGPLETIARGRSRSWRRSTIAAVTALAACVALVLLVPTLFFHDLRSPIGKVSRSVLADGSLIWLDSGSAADFKAEPSGRILHLVRGRIHIAVAHDVRRPFRVEAQGAVIRDVGTEFSVDTEGELQVAVSGGLVEVQRAGSKLTLGAGDAATFVPGRVGTATHYDTHAEAAWRSGRLILNDTPLEEALRQAERYRPGRIVLLQGQLGHRKVSGALSIDRLDNSLDALALSEHLRLIRLPYLLIVTSMDSAG